MTGSRIVALAAAATLAACNSNTAPGNDQEAELEAPAEAAPHRSAQEALSGIATAAVQPETMTEADLESLGGIEDRCVLRLTEVALPSFVYGGAEADGTIKLNGSLITLAAGEDGIFRDGELTVQVRRIDTEAAAEDPREAEMIVRLPGAADELGFRGYEICGN